MLLLFRPIVLLNQVDISGTTTRGV